MVHYISGNDAAVEVYIGDTPATGDFINDNTLCHTGRDAGVVSCDGQGQYLIFREPLGTEGLQFSEIFAWNEPEIA